MVGEGRVEEGGGVKGSEAPRRSTRGDQAAVCVDIDTQSCGFGSDEAHFALQTGVKCRAAEEELILVWLRWHTHEGEVVLSLPMGLEKTTLAQQALSSLIQLANLFGEAGAEGERHVEDEEKVLGYLIGLGRLFGAGGGMAMICRRSVRGFAP